MARQAGREGRSVRGRASGPRSAVGCPGAVMAGTAVRGIALRAIVPGGGAVAVISGGAASLF